jgi:hypothetical protein
MVSGLINICQDSALIINRITCPRSKTDNPIKVRCTCGKRLARQWLKATRNALVIEKTNAKWKIRLPGASVNREVSCVNNSFIGVKKIILAF